jgi:hypothetical protein
LTTLLLLTFGGLGAADVGGGALIVGIGVPLGRGEGAADGLGEGAADGLGEGAADGLGEGAADGLDEDAVAGPSFVLILSLVVDVGRGIGEWMAGGVEMPDGMLTGGGAGRGAAAAGTGTSGGAGGGTGVFTTGAGAGAGVEVLEDGLEDGFEGGLEGAFTITGGGETRGVAVFDSCLAAMGRGTGEAFVESGIGSGELAIGGENIIDCCFDLAGPGSADDGGGDPTGFSFSDSFVFGAARGGGGCTIGATGAGRAGITSTGGT